MAWSSQVSQNVNSGAQSARINLLPGEWAHVQVEYTSATTNRMRVSVFATLENDPGVADLDVLAMPEFRLFPGESISFIVPDVFAFVVAIANDEAAESLTAAVRHRKSGVDLSP